MYGFLIPDAMTKPKSCEKNDKNSSHESEYWRKLTHIPEAYSDTDAHSRGSYCCDHCK